MRSVWPRSPWVALLLSALLGRGTDAAHAGPKRDLVHRLAKAQITAHPLRRDERICQADFTLCADSVGGGCCLCGYECATES